MIGLAWISQKYHQTSLKTDKYCNFSMNFIKMSLNILKIKLIFFDFVIWYRFLLLFEVGLSCYMWSMLVVSPAFDVDSI